MTSFPHSTMCWAGCWSTVDDIEAWFNKRRDEYEAWRVNRPAAGLMAEKYPEITMMCLFHSAWAMADECIPFWRAEIDRWEAETGREFRGKFVYADAG